MDLRGGIDDSMDSRVCWVLHAWSCLNNTDKCGVLSSGMAT